MCFTLAHMGRVTAETAFAKWLDEQLVSQALGVRTLARRINGDSPEMARRALNRYLYEGALPSAEYRAAIAAALGVPEADMPGEEQEVRGPAADPFRAGDRRADGQGGGEGAGADAPGGMTTEAA